MGAVIVGCTIMVSCKNNETADARQSVEQFYQGLSSPSFKEDALRKGFADWSVEMTDSDIVTRISVVDLHFGNSKVASKNWVESQRQATLSNYRMIVASDSLVNNAFSGMRALDMKYKAIYLDEAGDSVEFVILPEEIVGTAE